MKRAVFLFFFLFYILKKKRKLNVFFSLIDLLFYTYFLFSYAFVPKGKA